MATDSSIDVAYLRVSTGYQHCEAQQTALEQMCADNPRRVVWISDTVSGRKMNGKGLTKLRQMVETGRVKRIIVYAWDRLGRNVRAGLAFVDRCAEKGVIVVSKCEPWDVSTPEGRYLLVARMNDSEFYLNKISQNTKMGLAHAAVTCRKCGRHQRDHRSKTGCQFEARFQPHRNTPKRWMSAKVEKLVPEILRLRDSGISLKKIAKVEGLDERTVAKICRERDSLPPIRDRVWDK